MDDAPKARSALLSSGGLRLLQRRVTNHVFYLYWNRYGIVNLKQKIDTYYFSSRAPLAFFLRSGGQENKRISQPL